MIAGKAGKKARTNWAVVSLRDTGQKSTYTVDWVGRDGVVWGGMGNQLSEYIHHSKFVQASTPDSA